MKQIKFKECNITYAENQPEYLSLPTYKTKSGEVTSCWKLSFFDKLRIIITGRMFLSILTFNNPLQPQKMSVKNPCRGIVNNDSN